MLSKPPEHVAMRCTADQTVFIIILLTSTNCAKRCCPLIPCLLVPVGDSQVVFQNCLRMHPCWFPWTTAPPHSQQLGCWLHTHTHSNSTLPWNNAQTAVASIYQPSRSVWSKDELEYTVDSWTAVKLKAARIFEHNVEKTVLISHTTKSFLYEVPLVLLL